MKLKVSEIFYSIQNEGHWSGRPAWFIRLSGCNLTCSWCDADHTEKEELTIDEIISKINTNECKYAVITGGEPTTQGVNSLIANLLLNKFRVAIETNGTEALAQYKNSKKVWISCSPKKETNYLIRCFANEIKLVVDEKFEAKIMGKYKFFRSFLFLIPEGNKPENIKKCIKLVEKNPNWRLGVRYKINDYRK